MREKGKRMPLPDEWIDPCREMAGGWEMPRRTAFDGEVTDEGLDLPVLDALVLGVPQRNAARLEQRVGRVSRAAPGKVDAIVVDLVDGGKAGRLWYSRRKVYASIGCAL